MSEIDALQRSLQNQDVGARVILMRSTRAVDEADAPMQQRLQAFPCA